MRRSLASNLFLTVMMLGVFAAQAAADPIPIASVPIDVAIGVQPSDTDGTGRFTLAVTPTQTNRLFSERVISEATVGTTLVANASNDPHFAEFQRQLTNGVGNYIEWLFGVSPGTGGGSGYTSEGGLFALPNGIPDFKGFTISSLTLAVEGFTSGSDPSMPGLTRLSFQGRLSVLGQGQFDPTPVPEPATLTLLTTGAVGLFGAWRRRRRDDLHQDAA